jgi:hypothetical protein
VEKFVLVLEKVDETEIQKSAELLKRQKDEKVEYILRDNFSFGVVLCTALLIEV